MAEEQQNVADTVVRDVPSAHRFEISVDRETAGFTEYTDDGAQRVFFHTEVDDRFAGRGLAGTLVGQALDATRAAGLRVVPVCPYVARFVKKHAEYEDIVDAVTPTAEAAVRAAKK